MHVVIVPLFLICFLAWGNLGNVLYNMGRLEEAEQAYKNALYHRPNMADAHYN